jgi:hypothetical protein
MEQRCSVHDSPLFDHNTAPLRCEFAEENNIRGACVFERELLSRPMFDAASRDAARARENQR